jgi:hypothetical protein
MRYYRGHQQLDGCVGGFGWDVNQPGVRTPAELPWCVDAAERPDTGTHPSPESAAAVPFAHRAIAVTAHS